MKLLDGAGLGGIPALRPAGHPRALPALRARREAGSHSARAAGARPDPRPYQIAVLSLLLVYSWARLDLEIVPGQAVSILAAALLTQLAATRLTGLPRFDPRSALISGLSLCLLLRTDRPGLAVAGAVVAVASKFVVRLDGKHVFNPSNFASVAMMLATGQVWVSPGQWGSVAVLGFLLAAAGGLVVSRAGRADVTWTFLAAYATLLVGRALWLGDPLAIPLHRLTNGTLVLFSFFMISDPRTTPDSRAGRIVFAVLVALGAYLVQFGLYRTNGLLPGPRHSWRPAPDAETPHERNRP
jgi:hypothetical protein